MLTDVLCLSLLLSSAGRQQMMGAESMGIVTVQLSMTDEKVCKNYLCGTCPHVVFQNTVCPHSADGWTTTSSARGHRRRGSSPLSTL